MKFTLLVVHFLLLIPSSAQNWVEESKTLGLNFIEIGDTIKDKNGNPLPISNAMYPNGEEGIKESIANNFEYPKKAQKKNIEGRVVVTYVVEKTGYLSNIEVIEKVHPLLDKEAKRVVKQLDRFVPALENGTPVRTQYSVPISFKLE